MLIFTYTGKGGGKMSFFYKESYGTCSVDNQFTCIAVKYTGIRILGSREEQFKESRFSCSKMENHIKCDNPDECPVYLNAPIVHE